MTGPGRHDEKTAFLEVWQRVSAGLTAIRAGLDQLPPRGRAELDRIFRDLEFQHARLLAEVDSMPATTVAGIAFVERAIDELRALENRIGGLARFARPAPAPEPPRSLSSPAFPVGSPMPSGDRYSAIVNELEAAFSRAEIARPMDGHYASQQRPGAPYPAPFQHPVQIVYVPHPMPPQHRRRRSDDEADGEASGMRRKSSTSVRPHRNADETPFGFVSTLLKGMGGVTVLVAGAVMISNFSFADLFGSGGTRPERTQVALQEPVRTPGRTASTAAEPEISAQAHASGEKFTSRLERTRPQPRRVTLPVEAQSETANATVAPMARVRPAMPTGQLQPSDLEVGFQATSSKSPSRQPAAAAAPIAAPQPPPAPKKPTIIAAVPPPSAVQPSPRVVAPSEPATPTDPPDTGGGLYVAVLSTHKEAKTARDEFVELQKKHRDILGAKQSEVQMAAGASGTWHRLVVTPAVAKEEANEICSRLRNSGYGRCWVKPY